MREKKKEAPFWFLPSVLSNIHVSYVYFFHAYNKYFLNLCNHVPGTIINVRDTVESKAGKVPVLRGFTVHRGETDNKHAEKCTRQY